MRKLLKYAALALLALAVILGITVAYVLSWPDFGGSFEGERLARMQTSAQYTDGAFANDPPPPGYDFGVSWDEMMGDQVRRAPKPFPVETPTLGSTVAPGLRATWFGHATVLVEIDGRRIMTDPMLSQHAFPVTAVAPDRWNPSPIPLEDMPKVDVVTVSHDHYDHLDMRTVQHLAKGGTHFFIGLGVGAHLETWGVPAAQIHEMDWWQTVEHRGLKVHCTPARHYSGRKSMDNSTLWASWVIEGPEHRIFHSGDTGYAGHFEQIREKRGPIDIAFVKVGDYGQDAAWRSIHMVPEDSIRGHIDLGAKIFFPIHWGTFELSYHDWDEPMRRTLAAAAEHGVELVHPKLGETVVYGERFENSRWWESL